MIVNVIEIMIKNIFLINLYCCVKEFANNSLL